MNNSVFLNSANNQAPNVLQLKNANTQENFGALDKEKIKQDALELANKGKDQVKENWLFKTLKKLGVKDPKKTLISIGLTLTTVVGLAILGNKSTKFMTNLGQKVDDVVLDDTKTFGKACKTVGDFVGNVWKTITKPITKTKLFENISNTLKNNPAKPKADLTRGYGRGFSSIFALTVVDTLKKATKGKNLDEITQLLKKMVGSDDIAQELAKQLTGKNIDNIAFSKTFSKAIKAHLGGGSTKGLLKALEAMKDGKIGDEAVEGITDVLMQEGGQSFFTRTINSIGHFLRGDKWKDIEKVSFISDWWPANIIDNIGRKIRGDKWKNIGRGNLGDALIKFNAIDGSLADTKIGSFVQKFILVPTESISNFVNDKSGMGALLCGSVMSVYNSTQDAPKGKKISTVADDFIGTIGSIAISTPLAFKATYGLASLANIEKQGMISSILKKVGSVFGMGLKEGDGVLKRFGGGALRFYLIMFAFAGLFSKPIRSVIHKIFGKPYDAAEEKQKQELEAQKKTVIPELNITYGELEEKIKNNPQVIQQLQTDPMLARKVGTNPQLLVDLLDGKEISTKPKNVLISPINQEIVSGKRKFSSDVTMPKPNVTTNTTNSQVDSATYIPSSAFVASDLRNSQEKMANFNSIMLNSNNFLKEIEKKL